MRGEEENEGREGRKGKKGETYVEKAPWPPKQLVNLSRFMHVPESFMLQEILTQQTRPICLLTNRNGGGRWRDGVGRQVDTYRAYRGCQRRKVYSGSRCYRCQLTISPPTK